MGKKYWFLTTLIFVLGISMGVGGHILWGITFDPNANSSAEKENASKVDTTQTDQTVPYVLPDTADTSNATNDSSALSNSLNTTDTSGTSDTSDTSQIENLPSAEVQQEIISQYKQALGILFDAWKAKDMTAFRVAIADAYTGELREKHIAKAESFITQGIGLDISNIVFDDVKVESADNTTATVNAVYRYTARDYDLSEQYALGQEQVHEVRVRANLVKIDSRWMITGETAI